MTTSFVRRLGTLVLLLVVGSASGQLVTDITQEGPGRDVFAGFDLSAPETGPFPSDIFAVGDTSHDTEALAPST
jgi:hypothetical protein